MYRTSSHIDNYDNVITIGPRWGATFWRKLKVRFLRKIWNLREPFAYSRRYKQYLRDVKWYDAEIDSIFKKAQTAGMTYGVDVNTNEPSFHFLYDSQRLKKLRLSLPPRPLPPPVPINE